MEGWWGGWGDGEQAVGLEESTLDFMSWWKHTFFLYVGPGAMPPSSVF